MAGEDDNLIASSEKKKRRKTNERKARPALELMLPFKTRRLDNRFASKIVWPCFVGLRRYA